MKKIFAQATKVFLLICLVLLATSCATEELSKGSETAIQEYQNIDNAKVWFENNKNNYSTSILNYVKDFEWQNGLISNGEIGQVIEIPFNLTDNLSSTNRAGNLYNDHHRLMFIKDTLKTYKLFYVQILASDKESEILDKNYNYYNIKDNFDGKVFVQELATNFSSKVEFKNGSKIIPSLTSKMREQAIECVWIGYWSEDGAHFDPVRLLYCEGGGSDGDDRSNPGPGYGGGGTSSGNSSGQTIGQSFEKKIISDKLNPCPKEVLEMLKKATNCDIANLINKLGANKAINVTVITEAPTDGKPAQTIRTNPLSKYDYTVRVSPDYTSATTLFRASNILHELTHAYFMSLIDDYNTTGNPVVFADTPTLFQAYCDRNFPPKLGEAPNLHHKEMADTYVEAIGAALQEFQTGVAVANGQKPDQIYTDLAWGGLRGTPIYNQTFPVNSDDYKRIEARYAAESNGGTSGNQTAVGKPCKI